MNSSNMAHLIQRALDTASFDADAYERARVRAHMVVEELSRSTSGPARRSTRVPARRGSMRVVWSAVALAMLTVSIATAAIPSVRSALIDAVTPARDHVDALDQPNPEVTPEPAIFGDGSDGVEVHPAIVRKLGPPSSIDPSTVRILLDQGAGQAAVRIYAAPHSGNGICFLTMGALASGRSATAMCVDTFDPDHPVRATGSQGPSGEIVSGVAADEVDSVSIRTSDGLYKATMGHNAFLWQRQTSDPSASEIIATLRDGHQVTIPFGTSDGPLDPNSM